MPRRNKGDIQLIKGLREKLRQIHSKQIDLQKQERLINATIQTLMMHSTDESGTTAPKIQRKRSGGSLRNQIIESVVALCDKKGTAVSMAEIQEDLRSKHIEFSGKANPVTRISGILSREIKGNGKSRIKKHGRGMYMKAP
jgi:hypothetical protein